VWLLAGVFLPLIAALLAWLHATRYGGSVGLATVLFLACSVAISLWIWAALTHLHPAPYWRPVSPYILPGWDKPM
jgi:hypothetical protein